MTNLIDIWKRGDKKQIWNRFCGYLDLTVPAFMRIQEGLLMEQLQLLIRCELGRRILRGKVPNSVEEFRAQVPVTDYSFYEAYLSQQNEDVLPVKPRSWVCTSGASGAKKWIPISEKAYEALIDSCLAIFILATSTGRGEFSLKHGDTMFNATPAPPWFSGFIVKEVMEKALGFRLIPPMDEEYMNATLEERVARGFRMAIRTGIDILPGLPSVLAKAGEHFGKAKKSPKALLDPRVAARIVKGVIKSRKEGRAMLPKDLWKFKTLTLFGMDISAFREKIKYYWGADPFEFYANTEFNSYIGTLTWNLKGLTFSPSLCFLEFAPEAESSKRLKDPSYQPSTVLLNQLVSGQLYELVFTNFNMGVFTRYCSGDILKVLSLEDEETGIKLPQFMVKGRADKLIDIGGFTRIDERTIWLALENSGVKYGSWIARKEVEGSEPILRLYLETDSKTEPQIMAQSIHNSLKEFDSSYKALEDSLGMKPLRVTLLPPGTSARWEQELIASGADPAWIKAQHVQPSEQIMERILSLAKKLGGN